MVTITGYKVSENKEGEEFVRLEVQGGVLPVRSQKTGKLYLTSKKAYIASTYNEQTAEALVGVSIPGEVEKVDCDPFEYTIKDTGETITMSHRYEYVEEVVKSKGVIADADVQQFQDEPEEITI